MKLGVNIEAWFCKKKIRGGMTRHMSRGSGGQMIPKERESAKEWDSKAIPQARAGQALGWQSGSDKRSPGRSMILRQVQVQGGNTSQRQDQTQ